MRIKDLIRFLNPIKLHQVFHDHEIDLHIENLIESWKGLSNFDIVSIQLSSFRKDLIKHWSIMSLFSCYTRRWKRCFTK
ncbi:MAG: hypothetical protein CM15mP23_10090 [Cryomorphaceae bacterium]|nr:MAG: hypothetical protein CM15mP23_10090 [Cryomorphaceae bacterium]